MAISKVVEDSQQSTVAAVPHSYTVRIIKKSLPTTVKMVDHALIELHSTKGMTFKQLLTFIAGKYVIALTKHRETLIKKHLMELRKSEDLKNTTGKGLNGRFKLKDKKKMISTVESKKRTSTSRRSTKEKHQKVARKKTSTIFQLESTPSQSMQLTSTASSEMSTILVEDSHTGNHFQSMFDTPLSSLPVKKRRISGRRI